MTQPERKSALDFGRDIRDVVNEILCPSPTADPSLQSEANAYRDLPVIREFMRRLEEAQDALNAVIGHLPGRDERVTAEARKAHGQPGSAKKRRGAEADASQIRDEYLKQRMAQARPDRHGAHTAVVEDLVRKFGSKSKVNRAIKGLGPRSSPGGQ